MYFSGYFQDKLFPPKKNVFEIFKFELNPLDNKKDISLYVLFRTFSGHFRSIFRTLV